MVRYILFIAVALFVASANSINADDDCHDSFPDEIVFTENRGQIINSHGAPEGDILFRAKSGIADVYLRRSGISYVFVSEDSSSGDSLAVRRVDVDFRNASAPSIETLGKVTSVSNYYLPHCPHGITGVRNYKSVVYNNIYQGIDIKFSADYLPGRIACEFIIGPGAEPEDISMEISGMERISLSENDRLRIFGEDRPLIEQTIISRNSETKLSESFFSLNDNIISLNIPASKKDRPQTFTPVVIWSSYFGGKMGDHANDIVLDGDNHFLITGNTLSANFPVTPGAFKTIHTGTYEAYAARMTPGGTLLWSTYYGGGHAEYCNSVTSDNKNNAIISGWTWSEDFPTSEDAFQTYKVGGDMDCFIVKFDSEGKRIWATLVGGSGDEHVYDVGADSRRNIVISGWTNSYQFPVSDDAYQKYRSGENDVFIIKFSAHGEYMWGTFLGDGAGDYCEGLAIDNDDDIYFTGHTLSMNFPNTGQPRDKINKDSDIFITKFKSHGEMDWSRLYGNDDNDFAYDICINNNSELLIAGHTDGNDLEVGEDAFQQSNNGSYDVLLFRLDMQGNLLWSTYYGGSGEDFANSLNTDAHGNLLITGRTGSEDFPVTPGVFQRDYAGNIDAFAIKIDNNCENIYWASYLGGSGEEWGWGIAADDSLNVIICGDTESPDFPILFPPHQSELDGEIDGFIVKFCRTNPSPVISAIGDTAFCEGDSVILDAGEGYRHYEWNDGRTGRKIVIKESGEYSVTVTDSVGCKAISEPVNITVWDIAPLSVSGPEHMCGSDPVTLYASEGFEEYMWSDSTASATITIDTPGEYSVEARDSMGCTARESIIIKSYPKPNPEIIGPTEVCHGSEMVIYSTRRDPKIIYKWEANNGEIMSPPDNPHIYVNWGQKDKGKIILRETFKESGCSATATLEVKIGDKLRPVITSSTSDFSACDGDTLTLDAGEGYNKYAWSDGSLSRKIEVTQSGEYICKVTGENDCKGADTVNVIFHPLPDPEIYAPAEICSSESGNIGVSCQYSDNASYEWIIDGGEISEGNGTNDIKINITEDNCLISVIQTNDSTGCSGHSPPHEIVVRDNPQPEIIAETTEVCEGDSVCLSAAKDFPEYLWSDGSDGKSVWAKSSGTYALTVKNNFNCVGKATIEITVNPLPPEFSLYQNGDTLFAPEGYEYEWYKDGKKITEDKYFHNPADNATFYVIIINDNGCSRRSPDFAYSQPYSEFVTISLPDTISAKAGDLFRIKPFLTDHIDLKNRYYPFIIHFTYNHRIMVAATDYEILNKTPETITIRQSGRLRPNKIEIGLEFFSALGNVPCAPITIDSIYFPQDEVRAETTNGVFCVADLCKADGLRLFFDEGDLNFRAAPNPFSDAIDFRFELIENGRTTLGLFDALGRERAILMNEIAEPGDHRRTLDGSKLPQGIYYYVLKTPTLTISGKIYRLK